MMQTKIETLFYKRLVAGEIQEKASIIEQLLS